MKTIPYYDELGVPLTEEEVKTMLKQGYEAVFDLDKIVLKKI